MQAGSRNDNDFGRIEAVVFDMDGLLLDSEVIARDTFVETCHDFKLKPDVNLFMRCVGVNAGGKARILAHGLGDKVDSEAFDKTWDRKYTRSAMSRPNSTENRRPGAAGADQSSRFADGGGNLEQDRRCPG